MTSLSFYITFQSPSLGFIEVRVTDEGVEETPTPHTRNEMGGMMYSSRLQKVLPAALIALATLMLPITSAFAAGTMTGVVIDGLTGQPVRGATVQLEGTDVSLTTDIAGFFRSDIDPGTYSAIITMNGYDSQKILEVVITDSEVTDFAVVLLPAAGTSVDGAAESTDAGDGESAAFTGEITIVADLSLIHI